LQVCSERKVLAWVVSTVLRLGLGGSSVEVHVHGVRDAAGQRSCHVFWHGQLKVMSAVPCFHCSLCTTTLGHCVLVSSRRRKVRFLVCLEVAGATDSVLVTKQTERGGRWELLCCYVSLVPCYNRQGIAVFSYALNHSAFPL
jgi:hypothetical protein